MSTRDSFEGGGGGAPGCRCSGFSPCPLRRPAFRGSGWWAPGVDLKLRSIAQGLPTAMETQPRGGGYEGHGGGYEGHGGP
jgi:hypothetical protein